MIKNISKLNHRYEWLSYKLYCFNNGVTEGNYNNFRKWKLKYQGIN